MSSGETAARARGPAARARLFELVGVREVLLAVALLALVPALGLTAARALEERHEAAADARLDALAVAQLAAREETRLLDEAHQLLVALAQVPAVRSGAEPACSRLLARLVRILDAYANLGVADAGGQVVCSGVPRRRPVDISDRAYFQEAVARRGFAIGEYQIGRITGKATLNAGVPVLEAGRVRAVVFAALDLDHLARAALRARPPDGSVVNVLDLRGTVLAREPGGRRYVGQRLPEGALARAVRAGREQVIAAPGIDGVRRYFGVVPLRPEGGAPEAVVAVGVPVEAALAPAGERLRRELAVLALVGLAALGVALLGGYALLVAPVGRLTGAARALAAGRLDERADVRRAPRELAELGRAFDEMAAALAARERELRELNDTLERRVEERTAELEQAYTALARQASITSAVLDSTTDAIRLVGHDGETILVNAEMERMAREVLHLQPRATLWEELDDLADRTDDPAAYRRSVQAIARDPELVARDEYRLVDSGRWIQRYTAPVRDADGRLIGRMFVFRDVTAEREAEELRSQLVATVSHELRTPLASILGFAELLAERELDPDTRRRYVDTVAAEARRLTALVNDFLDLQRIEAGGFAPVLEALDLRDVLRAQVEVFSAQSREHELQLTVPEEPLAVVGDRERLGQVLANLLSNAIKYSPEGGPVVVRGERRGDVVRVSVSDRGIGVPADQQGRLFTRFFRVDSSDTRAIGGTGLGLALVRELVEAHRGRVGVDSVEGEGSTFWFELPAARRGAIGSSRILVVEDDPAAASLLVEYLTADGYEVEVVASGEEALERAREDPPRLITLDVTLAGALDGWQVLAALKAHPETERIPVIVCTAGNGAVRAASLGASDFLVKPFSRSRLRSALARLLPRGGGTVLVVDDDEAVRRLVRDAFAGERDVSVQEAADGAEALARMRGAAPDVVVLDLVMPGVDGLGVLAAMQGDVRLRAVPVVVLTGKELSLEERRLLTARVFSVLGKSAASPVELRRLVARALAGASPE